MDRIVVDPDQLRRVAARMRGATVLLSSTGRQLTSRPLPSMPAALASVIAESLHRVNSELQELAAGLTRDAGDLLARATWAEVGQSATGDWPYGGSDLLSPDLPVDAHPSAEAPVLSEEQLARAEEWSLQVMHEDVNMSLGADDGSAFRHDVVADLSAIEREGFDSPFGDLTLTADDAPDGGTASWLTETATGPGRGALGVVLSELSSDTAGAGILGCIAVGAGMDGPTAGPEDTR